LKYCRIGGTTKTLVRFNSNILSLKAIETGFDLIDSQRNASRNTIKNNADLVNVWRLLSIFVFEINYSHEQEQHTRLINIHAVDVNEGKSLKLRSSYE
jgi:hypothetical protein